MEKAQAFQAEINAQYADSASSPLTEADRASFTALAFFPIDTLYRVTAKVTRIKKAKTFKMVTTTERRPLYKPYATLDFVLQGDSMTLFLYQNIKHARIPAYKDYLFLPFTDETNGTESYGGGRFLDVKIPEGDSMVIDFNMAYNPYCAYNHKYSCPVPPSENHVSLPIRAGVMAPDSHEDEDESHE